MTLAQSALIAVLVLKGVDALFSVPSVVKGPLDSYGWLSVGICFVGLQLLGALSSSGAFEVIDADTGKVYYSKLQTGRMPKLNELLAVLPSK